MKTSEQNIIKIGIEKEIVIMHQLSSAIGKGFVIVIIFSAHSSVEASENVCINSFPHIDAF